MADPQEQAAQLRKELRDPSVAFTMKKRMDAGWVVEELLAEIAALRRALSDCKAAISSPLNRESIVDTVWMSETETLVDHIDAVIPTPSAGGAHG